MQFTTKRVCGRSLWTGISKLICPNCLWHNYTEGSRDPEWGVPHRREREDSVVLAQLADV